MARPLLLPSAFLTLAGVCPACLDETRDDAASTVPQEVVAVAVEATGNGRTPGYDQGVMRMRADPRGSGVMLVAEPGRAVAPVPPPVPPLPRPVLEAPPVPPATAPPQPTPPAREPPAADQS